MKDSTPSVPPAPLETSLSAQREPGAGLAPAALLAPRLGRFAVSDASARGARGVSRSPRFPTINSLAWQSGDYDDRQLPIALYRFLRDSVPAISGCVWTWSRLVAAPAVFSLAEDVPAAERTRAEAILRALGERLFPFRFRRAGGLSGFLPMVTESLFTDGAFAGFVEIAPDLSQVSRIVPVDVSRVQSRRTADGPQLFLDTAQGAVSLDRPDFIYFALHGDSNDGLGRSIISAAPFVSFVEQQLVDDMRRASHNAGYHRLHVKVTPPQRQTGESESAFADRANEYFDKTAELIRDLRTEDNPVTWNDIAIEYIGPNRARGEAEGWFINHRAMIEEICAAANLSPFMLGYSFGATESWSGFKYDLVMRQVVTVQEELARIMEWVGNLELALRGLRGSCRFEFDNRASFTAADSAKAQATAVDSLVKLYSAGLLDESDAKRQGRQLATRGVWL